MRVILTERIRNLGNLGDEVSVKNGFARNYLIPYGKAISVTKENKAKFSEMRAELEKRLELQLQEAQKQADQLTDAEVSISVKATAEGNLYGSIGTVEITDAINTIEDVSISKSAVRLNDGVLTELGQYDIVIQLHTDIAVTVNVMLKAEE